MSVDPLEPATVENRTNTGVCIDGSFKKPAFVYFAIDSYTWNTPCAAEPRACTMRSGIRSWSKCVIFSLKIKSSSSDGPLSPAFKLL